MSQIKTVGIATLVEREWSFKKCIESLYPQVDRMFAVLNNYKEVPKWLKELPKVSYMLGDNELGASGKFYSVGLCDGYYFAVDDDFVYPSGYIEYMCSKIDIYRSLVYLGGKRYDKRPIKHYTKDYTFNTKYYRPVPEDIEVDIGLNFTCSFHTDDFKLSINDFHFKNYDDAEVSKKAHEQGVKIMVVTRPQDYMVYIDPPGYTAYKELVQDDSAMTELVNSFLK